MEKIKNKKDAAKPVEDVRTLATLSQLSATFTAGDRLSDENTIVSAGQTCSCRSRCVLFVLQRNAASLSLCLVEVQLSVTRDSRFNLALASTLCSIWARVTWASILPKCYISPSHKQSHYQQRKTKHAILALEHNPFLVPGVWVKAHPITC